VDLSLLDLIANYYLFKEIMAIAPGSLGFQQLASSPAAPPAGFCIIYSKTDNILYLKDSSGVEVALGSASAITSLTGEATATGPGAASVTLSNSAVIGKVLTGFTSGPNAVVSATDTLLTAIQKLQAQISATSGAAITSLTGDVTGTGPGATATTVATVGGQSASDISDSVDDTQAATPTNTASTIVKRDASGNFAANVITASLSGNATTATTATSFSGNLLGDVTGTQAATVVDTVGGQTAADISTSVDDTQAATSVNTASTIVKRDASGDFAANVISADLIGDVTGAASDNLLKAGDTMTGVLLSSNTTQSTTKDTGAVILEGGLGVEKNINAGGTIAASNFSGASSGTNTGDVTVSDSDTIDLTVVGQDISADVRISDSTLTSDVNGLKVDTVPAAQISGFDEAAQDAVGTSLVDTANIELIYNDGVPSISADLTDTAVAPDTYGAADKVAQITVDQKGRITSASDVVIDITRSQVSDFAHASSHLPSGSDPLATAAPIASLSATTTNSAGIAESFSKSDHSHEILTGTVSSQTPDQSNAAGSSANLARADHIHNIPSGAVVQIGTSNFNGASSSFALADHVHAHGNQTSGTLHAIVTTLVNGFMSAVDKVKLDAATALNTVSTLVFRDSSGNFAANVITADLTGSASNNLLKAGDSMTGYFRAAVVALSDGANISTDAALGNIFTVTIAGNRTFDAPTNPLADQKITYKIRQDAVGGRIITWDAAFNFGVDLAGVPNSTSPNIFDYYGFQYNATTSKWDCLAISRGY